MKKLLFTIGSAILMTFSSCSIFVSSKHHSAGAHIGSIENSKNVVPTGQPVTMK